MSAAWEREGWIAAGVAGTDCKLGKPGTRLARCPNCGKKMSVNAFARKAHSKSAACATATAEIRAGVRPFPGDEPEPVVEREPKPETFHCADCGVDHPYAKRCPYRDLKTGALLSLCPAAVHARILSSYHQLDDHTNTPTGRKRFRVRRAS